MMEYKWKVRLKIRNFFNPKLLLEKVRFNYRNMRIFYKILWQNLFLLGIFICIALLEVNISFHIYNRQLYQKTMQVISQFSNGIETDLKQIESFSLNTMLDPDIQNELESLQDNPDEYEQLIQTSNLQSKLLIQSMTQKNISTISYINNNEKVFTVGNDLMESGTRQINGLIEKAKEANGGYVFTEPSLQSEYFVSAREIIQYNNLSLAPMGTLLFGYDLKGIVKSNAKFMNDDSTIFYIYSGGKMIFKNTESKIVFPPDKKNGYCIQTMDGKKFFVVYVKSEYLDWTYVSILPYETIFRQDILMRDALLLSFLLLFSFSCYMTYRIARNITKPIEDLTSSMKQVETGDFQNVKSELFDYERGDEVGILQKDFLLMIQHIKKLIKQNYEKQLVIKDTEYRALQSQIDPHFLYNTFSSISWLSKAGRNEDVSTMVLSLSSLLRASVNERTVIFLEEEVKLLNNYISIQELRYADRAEFSVKIDRNHLQYIVPKMILQPIVENSIKYGVENMLGVCKIRVWSEDAGNDFRLFVSDNGPGIEPDMLNALNSFQYVSKGTGIGLKNIQKRIRLLFGEPYGLTMESGEGTTTVAVTIPKREV